MTIYKHTKAILIAGLFVGFAYGQDVAIRFEEGAELTPEQKDSVLQLAKECGISEPAQLRTYFVRPGTLRRIVVESRERTNGMRSELSYIVVRHSGWGESSTNEGVKHRGEFWVSPSNLVTNHFAEILVGGKSCRVQISDDISVERAQLIFNAIAGKELQAKSPLPDVEKANLRHMEGAKPEAIDCEKDNNEFTVFYSGGLRARVRLVDDSVILIGGPSRVNY